MRQLVRMLLVFRNKTSGRSINVGIGKQLRVFKDEMGGKRICLRIYARLCNILFFQLKSHGSGMEHLSGQTTKEKSGQSMTAT